MLKLKTPSVFDDSFVENSDFSKGSMYVETYDPHLRLPDSKMREPTGHTTTTDSRSQRTQASREGGQITTRALSSSYGTACPSRVLPTPSSRSTQIALIRRPGGMDKGAN